MPLSDQEIIDRYIAWRTNPLNDRYEDTVFISDNHTSVDRLNKLLKDNPAVRLKIDARNLTEEESALLMNKVLRQSYGMLLSGEISPKSYEGVLNAVNNLIKTMQLVSGKPTERFALEDIDKMSTEEQYTKLMGMLRRPIHAG